MMCRKAARNMYICNTNKIGIQCICWFYTQGTCSFSNRFFPQNCQFIINYTFRLLKLYIEICAPLKASLRNAILNKNYYEISSPPFKYRYQGISNSVVKIIFPRVKRSELEADPSIPSSAQVKNMWSYTSATQVQLHFDV